MYIESVGIECTLLIVQYMTIDIVGIESVQTGDPTDGSPRTTNPLSTKNISGYVNTSIEEKSVKFKFNLFDPPPHPSPSNLRLQ